MSPPNFVDPSSLSLPSSSSLKRPASPSSSRADSPDVSIPEPPRKRPRSAITPEERKEARAHRNRIAAQNSRDRRKAQYSLLERRVAELEEENRRLRAGVPMTIPASPSVSSTSEPEVVTIQHEQERKRKRAEEQRERENLELRERIRTLEMGYEAVLRTLATQGANPATLQETSSSTPILSSACGPSPASAKSTSTADSASPTPSSPKSTSLATLSYPLSPAPTHSSLSDSPMLFLGDSFDFPLSPTFSLPDLTPSDPPAPVDTPQETLDLSSIGHAPTRHLAAGGQHTSSHGTGEGIQMYNGAAIEPEDEAATDAALTRLFAEILASPPAGTCALPGTCPSAEDTNSTQVLSEPSIEKLGLGLVTSGVNTANWAEQVNVEMGIERLLEMLPSTHDVAIDSSTTFDVDMDFSDALVWDEVSVY